MQLPPSIIRNCFPGEHPRPTWTMKLLRAAAPRCACIREEISTESSPGRAARPRREGIRKNVNRLNRACQADGLPALLSPPSVSHDFGQILPGSTFPLCRIWAGRATPGAGTRRARRLANARALPLVERVTSGGLKSAVPVTRGPGRPGRPPGLDRGPRRQPGQSGPARIPASGSSCRWCTPVPVARRAFLGVRAVDFRKDPIARSETSRVHFASSR
jgi:hypothetical protein